MCRGPYRPWQRTLAVAAEGDCVALGGEQDRVVESTGHGPAERFRARKRSAHRRPPPQPLEPGHALESQIFAENTL